MPVPPHSLRLFFRHHHRSVRLALAASSAASFMVEVVRSQPDRHSSSRRKLISIALAECVMAPAETKSAPASA